MECFEKRQPFHVFISAQRNITLNAFERVQGLAGICELDDFGTTVSHTLLCTHGD